MAGFSGVWQETQGRARGVDLAGCQIQACTNNIKTESVIEEQENIESLPNNGKQYQGQNLRLGRDQHGR